ncbi:MAG: DnaJ domain-containing protein [Xenococcaceae cyanobacterium]
MSMAKVEDYYSILQVAPHAPMADIKAAFRRLARLYHPDLNPDDPESAEKFKYISQAYETLSDPNKRRRYDLKLKFRSVKNNPPQPQESFSKSKTAQEYYNRGLDRSHNKNFKGAIEDYTKAIELDYNFIDAYLKRCEMRYKLGDNKGVLEDCSQVLRIDPRIAKAHYYQGRARYRLGYGQSAIDSYTQAINQDRNYAQAHYYRALAYREQKDTTIALADLQTAARLFQIQGNFSAYRQTQKTIKEMAPKNWRSSKFSSFFNRLWQNSALVLISYLFNPGGGLLPAFSSLEKNEALEVGIIYGIIIDLMFVCSIYLNWPNLSTNDFPIVQFSLVGIIPFTSLIISSHLIRFFTNTPGSLNTDVFLAGTTLFPLGLMIWILGFISLSVNVITLPLIICGCSYTNLTLYINCTQILNLSEAKAAFVTTIVLLIGIVLSYLAFIPILP